MGVHVDLPTISRDLLFLWIHHTCSLMTVIISFMITVYQYGLTVSQCYQSYKVECDIIPGSNFEFNCSAAIPAYSTSGEQCAELDPPRDICHQLTIVATSPGVHAVISGQGLAHEYVNLTVRLCDSKIVGKNYVS